MSTNSNYKEVRITGITEETPDAKTFYLEPQGWQAIYKAGQFLTIIFETPFGEKRRSYSISSSPDTGEQLSITVKRQENGEFSRLLIDHLKTGDMLLTSGIAGFFVLPESIKHDAQIFFIAAGSGITPCYSLIKTLLQATKANIVLIYSNRSEKQTIFYRQLVELSRKYGDRFKTEFIFTSSHGKIPGRLNKDLLLQLLGKHHECAKENTLVYMSGPFDYIRMAMITLISYGIPFVNLKKENFNHVSVRIPVAPPDENPHQVSIQIGQNTYQLVVQYPKSILSAAKENKVPVQYSCETGVCGSCVAKCTTGKVWMAYNEVLTEKDVANGLVLMCQGYPVGGDAELIIE